MFYMFHIKCLATILSTLKVTPLFKMQGHIFVNENELLLSLNKAPI